MYSLPRVESRRYRGRREAGRNAVVLTGRNVATIKIEQRVWHQDFGRPKSEDSRGILAIGDLAARFRAKAALEGVNPDAWIFYQKRDAQRPMWDSGVRDALHQAAQAEGCAFPGLGPHSFRRANIARRQEVGGSAIEASKILGHSDLEMTGEYTFVAPERQNELMRRIQQRLASVGGKTQEVTEPEHPSTTAPEAPPNLAELQLSTPTVQ